MNSHVKLERNGSTIYIVGVDDPYTWHDDLEEAAGKVDVILVGHLHGGQVKLPLLGKLYTLASARGYHGCLEGLYMINGTYIYVSRGVGCSIVPARFSCPPEVALITLVKS